MAYVFNDVEGTSYLKLLLKSKEKELAKNLNNVIKTKKTFNIRELRITSPDNVTHFFDKSCVPIFDKDGSIHGVLSISKNVTKRVNKEIQYQQSQKMLEDLTHELNIKNDKIRRLQTTLGERYRFHNLIGKNYMMQNIYNLIDRVSQTDSTILITGETGTGKELVARAIHYNSLRKDLFYRLNIISIRLPSLKERADDISLLVNHFIEKFNNRFKKNISGTSPRVLRKFMSYSWPGNIRELEGVIEKAVLLEEYDTIENIELLTDHSENPNLLLSPLNSVPDISSYDAMQEYLDNIEKEYFIKVFKKHKGKISDVAEFTGLNGRTILNKMKKFSIKKSMFKDR
ncbi:MAG: sigma 54-interacting transcriptional regulator [Candidatus Scalindua rubra]|uniref:Sigma-54 dependent transcriptional regulator n=1 Tax=Candidatus Scalindua brodae TaxID=237368 RepID=A0A0B0ESJ4_9BACT|nr:MAG: Sigma-54 dependent transcriptional regulator [Candidatus Scalindua brodae]MBZ0109392.1 sigma 54-interacting transcriptional regulator [Candidatus Scalindua rubra]TWU34820.1 Transcriptional regulatory protein ZraR [Candidatus Brocadiaceae bacterium S225]